MRMRALSWLFALGVCLALSGMNEARAQAATGTIDIGPTGFAIKRPVFAGACPNACPWGELGDFVKEAMAPAGYDVVVCQNCNRAEGPRIVSGRRMPPPLRPDEARVGTVTRFDAVAEFGATASHFLTNAYEGHAIYASDGPMRNLRLIAKIEDPFYLVVAVSPESGITDLSQVLERRRPIHIFASGPTAQKVLAHYGLTREAVAAIGGRIEGEMPFERAAAENFDIMISELGSNANNPESVYWPMATHRRDLRFLDLPEALIAKLVAEEGYERVTMRWGLLRGVDHPISTVGRSGESIFAHADVSNADAYAVARAIDLNRANLRWFVRPYAIDPRTVWKNDSVPLHPGAARYYREAGYMRRR
ncbi:MAG: hypothetical protein JNJ73_14780 [Hyphomonadaceae bacterium]|nr:hypothetical protein [Hyphomonadaceae bacterium]